MSEKDKKAAEADAEAKAKAAAEEAAKVKADAEQPKVREALPNEYPKMLYFKGDVTNYKVVGSVAEEDALGDDWLDRPDH